MRAVADGQPMREAARRFGVAVTTVKRAVVQQRETGSLERKPIPGCPRRIGTGAGGDPARPAASGAGCHGAGALRLVGGAPGAAVERGDDVAGHSPAGLDAQKKTLAASERDEQARAAWREAVATRDPAQFVFVDESSTHTSLMRLYGWAPHDQRATGSVPRNHGKNTTLVAALTPDGLLEPWLLIAGAMTSETFEWYIRYELAPRAAAGTGGRAGQPECP